MMFFIFSILFSNSVFADCGATLQTVWEVDLQKQELKLISKQKHSEPYCNPEKNSLFNAQLNLFSKTKELIYSQPIYFQDQVAYDLKNEHGILDLKKVNLQIKFATNSSLLQIKTVELQDQKQNIIARGTWW